VIKFICTFVKGEYPHFSMIQKPQTMFWWSMAGNQRGRWDLSYPMS